MPAGLRASVQQRIRIYAGGQWRWAVVQSVEHSRRWGWIYECMVGTAPDALLVRVRVDQEGKTWRWPEDDAEVCAERPAVAPALEAPPVGAFVDVWTGSMWQESMRVVEVEDGPYGGALAGEVTAGVRFILQTPAEPDGCEWRYSACGECGARAPSCIDCATVPDAYALLGEPGRVLASTHEEQWQCFAESAEDPPGVARCKARWDAVVAYIGAPGAAAYPTSEGVFADIACDPDNRSQAATLAFGQMSELLAAWKQHASTGKGVA